MLDLFVDGIHPDDIGALQPLLSARPLLNAFITLFRGGEDEVLARLLVLREIGARAEAPRWSPQDLRNHLAYIDPVKLETVLKRLREYDLLVWDNDEAVYWLSTTGRSPSAAAGRRNCQAAAPPALHRRCHHPFRCGMG